MTTRRIDAAARATLRRPWHRVPDRGFGQWRAAGCAAAAKALDDDYAAAETRTAWIIRLWSRRSGRVTIAELPQVRRARAYQGLRRPRRVGPIDPRGGTRRRNRTDRWAAGNSSADPPPSRLYRDGWVDRDIRDG